MHDGDEEKHQQYDMVFCDDCIHQGQAQRSTFDKLNSRDKPRHHWDGGTLCKPAQYGHCDDLPDATTESPTRNTVLAGSLEG